MEELWVVCITWNSGRYTEEHYNLERKAWTRWSTLIIDEKVTHASFHQVI